MTISIETASFAAVRDFIAPLVQAEGWLPSPYDSASFFSVDPEGWFLAKDEHDKKVGCISAVRYSETFAFIGVFIVLPECRRHGVGQALWDHAMRFLGDATTIGLDGVLAQEQRYGKAGFVTMYRHARYRGTTLPEAPSHPVVPLDTIPFDKLLEFDSAYSPAPRPKILQRLQCDFEGHGVACLDSDGRVLGYGAMRPCEGPGFKIGPLVAANVETARQVFAHLRHLAWKKGAATMYIDVPDCHPAAIALVREEGGFDLFFECARMYRKGTDSVVPSNDLVKRGVYGVYSLEIA